MPQWQGKQDPQQEIYSCSQLAADNIVKYHTEKDKEGNPVPFEADQMVVTTKQDAEVHYTFTSQESRDVWIKGYTQTVVPPVNPGPDSPELPPVDF